MLNKFNTDKIVKLFVYVVLIAFAVSIIIPVSWVLLASLKENTEFYGSPFALPKGLYFENFVHAIVEAHMGEYFLNSVVVTFLALVILIVIALPASYVLARYEFKSKKIVNALFMAGLFINVSYIVVPIFLMLVDCDKLLNDVFNMKFMLNNIVCSFFKRPRVFIYSFMC